MDLYLRSFPSDWRNIGTWSRDGYGMTPTAPARISADADPACMAGATWEAHQQWWEPYKMGARELATTRQRWILNEHDRRLLQRLSSHANLRPELKELCEAMQREGRKAEQESWL